ncbi:FeoA family protein [Sulfurimonas marina]|uniref:Ferrous iron transport protein A n=1 Tax=Sulfurimonas marina TaxID=2590551 RepID=A0A7M1AT41_9BACT|nr:FeoA family protein [Sulfurimonas marina]QOP40585.1 ferrous iron transport protein A [Sulfurimonas marina]
MRLIESKRGQKLEVVKLHANEELKHRLISFGIMKHTLIEFIGEAPRKKTIEIKVGNMQVALRAQEAEMIEVKEI